MRVKQKAIPLLLAVLVAVGALCCGVAFRSPRQGVSAAAASSNSMVDRDRKVANLPKGDTKNFYIISNLNDIPQKIDLAATDNFNDLDFSIVFIYRSLQTLRQSGLFEPKAKIPVQVPEGLDESFYSGNFPIGGFISGLSIMNNYNWDSDPPAYYGAIWAYRSFVKDKSIKSYSSNAFECYLDGNAGNAMYYLGKSGFRTETQWVYLEYDVQTCWVEFSYLDPAGNGEYIEYSYELPVGSEITDIPDVPNPPHATFMGYWNNPLRPVTQDITYRAQYTYESYTLTFKDRSNLTVSRQSKTFYDKLSSYAMGEYSEINGTKKTIYKCIGWTTEKDNASYIVDFNTLRLDRDLTLYPLYEVDKVVDLDAGGNEIPKEETQSWWDKLGAWKLWGWNAGKTAQGLLIVVFIIVGIIAAIYLVKFISWIVDAFATMKMKRDIRKLNREKRRGGY